MTDVEFIIILRFLKKEKNLEILWHLKSGFMLARKNPYKWEVMLIIEKKKRSFYERLYSEVHLRCLHLQRPRVEKRSESTGVYVQHMTRICQKRSLTSIPEKVFCLCTHKGCCGWFLHLIRFENLLIKLILWMKI